MSGQLSDGRVAVDVAGGDRAPADAVKGALKAARKSNAEILLVGPPDQIEPEIERNGSACRPTPGWCRRPQPSLKGSLRDPCAAAQVLVFGGRGGEARARR